MLVICDGCRREGPPNVRAETLERLGWKVRRKEDPVNKPDLCPNCR